MKMFLKTIRRYEMIFSAFYKTQNYYNIKMILNVKGLHVIYKIKI
jgi:hypothetical protein